MKKRAGFESIQLNPLILDSALISHIQGLCTFMGSEGIIDCSPYNAKKKKRFKSISCIQNLPKLPEQIEHFLQALYFPITLASIW